MSKYIIANHYPSDKKEKIGAKKKALIKAKGVMKKCDDGDHEYR